MSLSTSVDAPIASPGAPIAVAPSPGRIAPPPPAAPEPSRQPLSVLHIVNGEHFAGAERVQDLLGLRLPEFGYQVGYASLKPGRFADNRRATGAPLHEFNMTRRWDLRPVRQIARLAREDGYDLLHAHTPRSLLIASLVQRRTDLPLVYHVHSPASRDTTRRLINWMNDRLERWCGKSATQLITVSSTLTEHMRKRGYDADRLHCVYNGTPVLAKDHPAARTRSAPIGPLVVGMVALFRPRKGTEVMLDALATLRSRGHDVRLKAIGPFETPDYEEELKTRVTKLGLQEAVHWAGFTHDVGAELARVDALALPSLFGEGMPMVMLEAMAAGLPVVASRCEGTTEAVLHRETGLLVEPGSVSQLADALEEIATGSVDYGELSRAAKERHHDRFSAKAMARQVAAVYDGVLAPAR